MSHFEEMVAETKADFEQMDSEELLDKFVELHDFIRDVSMTDSYSESFSRATFEYDIVKFIIMERLQYFDTGSKGRSR